MSGAEGLVIGAVISLMTNLLTMSISPLLKGARAAMRCQQECRRLVETVEPIQRQAQHILGQFEELASYDASARYDLCVMVGSVEKLKRELALADIDVHDCNSASKFRKMIGKFGADSKLSKSITERNEVITGLGRDLVQVNGFLTTMLQARRPSSAGHQAHQVNPNLQQQQMLQHHRSLDLQQWSRDVDDIQRRESLTRHFQRLESENSLHWARYGSTSSGSSPSLHH